MTDYDELVREMREAAGDSNVMRRNDALHAGVDAIISLAQRNVQVGTAPDTELRREAAGLAIAASSSLGDSATPSAAAQWLAFLQDGAMREARPKGEWDLPTIQPGEDQREHLERVVGSALGAASTAWTGTPAGVFESSYVSGIVDLLMASIDVYAEDWADLGSQIAAETATWDGKGYTQEHDDEHGREHVLIQAMQYAIKRRYAAALALLERAAMTPMRGHEYPRQDGETIMLGPGVFASEDRLLLNWDGVNYVQQMPPAHGLAVGDVLNAEQAQAVPVGTSMRDRVGDTVTRKAPDSNLRVLSWPGFGRLTPERHEPYTVTALPEPEDTKVGD